MSRKKSAPQPEPTRPPGSRRKPLFRLHDLKTPPLPARVRIEGGTLLSRVQDGELLGMPVARPMPIIGAGVFGLRLSDRSGEWRIIDRVEPDIILLVDAFPKKAQATSRRHIRRAQDRLAAHDRAIAALLKADRDRGESEAE